LKKEQLGQYRSLKREIEELEDKILSYKTHDVVKSSAQFPYSPHCVTVSGYPSTRVLDKLKAQKLNCKAQCTKIENFINNIDDSLTRRIFRLRYLEGRHYMSWQCVATALGEADESFPRQKHNRYLKQNQK